MSRPKGARIHPGAGGGKKDKLASHGSLAKAGDGIRTHDNDVGNVVLYQLSYTRARAPG
jgi:hypothetical protein